VVGRGLAERITGDLGQLVSVTVYSPKNLEITAPGVTVSTFGRTDSAYRYRYAGLRLLQRSGGKYFLLPDGWTPASRQVIALPDDGTLRMEFGSTAGDRPAST
jgi:hypothetical protein